MRPNIQERAADARYRKKLAAVADDNQISPMRAWIAGMRVHFDMTNPAQREFYELATSRKWSEFCEFICYAANTRWFADDWDALMLALHRWMPRQSDRLFVQKNTIENSRRLEIARVAHGMNPWLARSVILAPVE